MNIQCIAIVGRQVRLPELANFDQLPLEQSSVVEELCQSDS